MRIDEFFRGLKLINVYKAEENYVLQRMLDNHVNLSHKEGLKIYNNIYKEFQKEIDDEIKIEENIKIDNEKFKEIYKKNLQRLRGGG